MAVVILFTFAGVAGLIYGGLDWAVPTGVLLGLLVAPMVPIPAPDKSKR